ERIRAFVRMTRENTPDLIEYGCPVGSLCTELQKQSGQLGIAAAELFTGHLQWLEQNFKQLNPKAPALRQAIHLLSLLEGATLLAHSFGDPKYINEELESIEEWLSSLEQSNQAKQ
ncbi:MAG: hypothetical protein KDK37_19450, partial [Leptospiraceae bacterium]|nr:hypothetical protein [Leptospiraceae bacterium]